MKSKAFDITMFIVILCLLLSSIKLAHAEEDYVNPKTWADNTEYYSYAITVADWLQTRQIRDTDGVYEKNAWICGKQPEEACVARWMVTKLAAIYWLNNHSGWTDIGRYKFNVWYSVAHTHAVINNVNIGLEIKF